MDGSVLSNCQGILELVQQKKLSNEESKEDFKRKFVEILKVISEDEGYKVEVESYAEGRLFQHASFDQELEEIEFKLEEINMEENDSLLMKNELVKIEKELKKLAMKYRFTKVFFWE